MKILSLITIIILFSSPLFAQQKTEKEPALVSELSKLRKSYIESLNHLLQQYVKSNDVASAALVSVEIDKVSSGIADAEPAPNLSPCGAWKWHGDGKHKNMILTVMDDGIATNTKFKTKGIWHWLDESKHQFQIVWQNGVVDTLTISPDGTTAQGFNDPDGKFRWDRIPSSNELHPMKAEIDSNPS